MDTELGHANLIRTSSSFLAYTLVYWLHYNLNFFPFDWASNKIPEMGQVALYKSIHLMPNIGKIDQLAPFECVHLYGHLWTQVNLQTTEIVFPHQPLFTGSMDGNFHEFPWVRDYFVAFENI